MSIFIGATICGATDAADYFGPVKVPGNKTREATIAAHKATVTEDRASHASFAPMGFAGSILPSDDVYENHVHRPMVGVLASVAILDNEGKTIYQQIETQPVQRGKVALPLINYLKETYPDQFGYELRYDGKPEVLFFGFNLKQVFRIAAFEALHRVGVDLSYKVPVRMWCNPIGVYDVLDVLLPANDQRDLDLYSVLKYFDVEVDAEQLATSSLVQAQTVAHLVERAQLTCTVS